MSDRTVSTGNLFLDVLPQATFQRLERHLKKRRLVSGTVLQAAGAPASDFFFPVSGVISVVVSMADGVKVEASLIGREGMLGLPAVLGDDGSPLEAVVQLPGSAWTIPKSAFLEIYRSDPELMQRVARYLQLSIITLSQLAGCNRLHDVYQRCARWLLMAQDRTSVQDLPLTQEFLATMLGTRRPTVSLATATLSEEGYIQTKRGRYAILDRVGLEAASCECYTIMNASCRRLMTYDIGPVDLTTR